MLFLLVDFQNDYFYNGSCPLEGSFEASLNAQEILQTFRNAKELVVHIRQVSNLREAGSLVPDSIGSQIHDHVRPFMGEKVMTKNSPNAFKDTELDKVLDYFEIHNVVICGMMTHLGVDSTTRAASDLGFDCTVISDACATRGLTLFDKKVSAQEVQTAFLGALKGTFAKVQTTEDFLYKYRFG